MALNTHPFYVVYLKRHHHISSPSMSVLQWKLMKCESVLLLFFVSGIDNGFKYSSILCSSLFEETSSYIFSKYARFTVETDEM